MDRHLFDLLARHGTAVIFLAQIGPSSSLALDTTPATSGNMPLHCCART